LKLQNFFTVVEQQLKKRTEDKLILRFFFGLGFAAFVD